MLPVLTPAEMAARDSAAIAGGVSEAVLVERAGGAVARGARRLLGGAYGRRVALKPGRVFFPGAALAGEVEVADIGIDPSTPPASLGLTEEADVAAWLPRRSPESHKWSVGGVYVVGGSQGMTGAVMLSSRAALRAGAGIVVAGLPGDAAARASGGEVITRSLPATSSGALDEGAAKEVLDGLDRFRA